jgi:NAD(P)-binding Rossmann-like domain
MSGLNATSASRIRKTGVLKILADPTGLLQLLPRATVTYEVTAEETALRWSRGGEALSALQGTQIESVQEHGKAFVVTLKAAGHGVKALTFEAVSDSEAQEWVEAIGAIAAAPAVTQSGAHSPPAATQANKTTIKLTYTEGASDVLIAKEFALLVIACDPRCLIGICDYTDDEIAIFNELVNFTFHTTLLKVKVDPAKPQEHGVIFAPTPLDRLDGSVYGFRNESAKKFNLETANGMDENLVTVYQLLGSRPDPLTPDQFQHLLDQQLPTLAWWPFGGNYEVVTSVTTSYFDHFSAKSLQEGKPWALLGNQGKKNTLLVHASTCFESALHCWGYAERMLANVPGAQQALPQDKGAPIAILGAGVSGLLFATRLNSLGYTNIQILESTDRYGGKTHTVIEHGPYPAGSEEPTYCELGTCYLSPAYKPMVKDLKTYLQGNKQIDFTQADPAFRGIVTEGQLPPSFDAPPVMNFSDYVVEKAVAERKQTNDEFHRIEAKLALAYDLALYGLLHILYVGWNPPMPVCQPEDLKGTFGQQTFLEFLQAHDLTAMVGSLQYGYEVQGYGKLDEIPAYYGLLWITPAITWAILGDQLGLENTPIVTAWTKGWGDLWTQIVEQQKLTITYNAQTRSIVRS